MKHSNRKERRKKTIQKERIQNTRKYSICVFQWAIVRPLFGLFTFNSRTQTAFGWNSNEFTRIASSVRLLLLDFIFDSNRFTNIDTVAIATPPKLSFTDGTIQFPRHFFCPRRCSIRSPVKFEPTLFTDMIFFYCIIICGHRHRDYTPFLWIWPGIKLNQMLMHTLCTYCITKTVQIGRTIKVERDENKTELCLNNDWPV